MILVYTGAIEFPVRLGLDKVVQTSLKDAKGEYAVAIKDLKTGESYSLNADKTFAAASLYKLWVMAETYRQIEKGQLKENEILSGGIADLNQTFEIASESAELQKGRISLPVQIALKRMITISHNYAALLLAERVKNSKISSFLVDYGFNNSKIGEENEGPTTTASDTLFFFEKLYKGQLTNKSSTEKMLNLLKDQELNDKLPKYLPAGRQGLPKNVEIAHKTGEIDYFSHDAGIVFSPKGDYIIVVLSESDFPQGAAERIANLSKNVYKYFSR